MVVVPPFVVDDSLHRVSKVRKDGPDPIKKFQRKFPLKTVMWPITEPKKGHVTYLIGQISS